MSENKNIKEHEELIRSGKFYILRSHLRKSWKLRNKLSEQWMRLSKTQAIKTTEGNLIFVDQLKKDKSEHVNWKQWIQKVKTGADDLIVLKRSNRGKRKKIKTGR